MKSGSNFLLAARQCEIAELEQLAQTCELVGVIARFIHALQRERGLSNIYLGSHGAQFTGQREQQILECQAAEAEVRRHLDQLDTGSRHARNGALLFSRVAVVLHALEGLPALRARIARQAMSAAEATAAMVKLVSGLLCVVFEAADTASDPKVSKALVAMFHFMQGKEFAGQERALGGRVFAAGCIDGASLQLWRHLVDSQQGCFQVYADCSDPRVLQADHAARDPAVLAEIERLRRIGCTVRGELDTALSRDWFHWCTRRIDEMKAVEDLLAAHLRELCGRRIEQAQGELRDQRAALDALSARAASQGAATPAPYGPHLERSLFSMVQEQSRRLQAIGDELDAVRTSLNERKLVERAKGLLMAHRQMSEEEAYKALRQMAMNQGRRLVDVAGNVLSLAEVLPAVR
ncbi:ANTAR domain-containing protein [Ramlibacter henchirensis]|uniref:ANTAR domain-containing protein n=1 Tax=Ramlibacter henchirensis TaxID=204072 RepID=A0A4Z0BUS3_9BURK|nr:nitrate regulatory protein [Ramlibacter henchirensis]TFZ02224.1 ANTAR domain-containing protein [Ramlibacter henchirensis]